MANRADMDLDAVAAELYALPPEEFTPRRDSLAAEARADGDSETARTIGRMRKPTMAAWLVNRLVREAPDQVEQYAQLGIELREAQAGLAGDRMRALSARRQTLIADLSARAEALVTADGRSVAISVRREVEETLQAGLSDATAAEALSTGILTRALSYSGLGEVDVSGATAVPQPRRSAPGERPARRVTPAEASRAASSHRPPGDAARPIEAVAAAQAALDAAERAADEAVRALSQLEAVERECEERVTTLQTELAAARRDLRAAGMKTEAARGDRDRLARAVVAAHRHLRTAREKERRVQAEPHQ